MTRILLGECVNWFILDPHVDIAESLENNPLESDKSMRCSFPLRSPFPLNLLEYGSITSYVKDRRSDMKSRPENVEWG
jgi:hypothetical protein